MNLSIENIHGSIHNGQKISCYASKTYINMEPGEAQPYDAWRLNDINFDGCATIRGVGCDPDTQRLFITQGFGDAPRVEVYRINSPSGATDSTGITDNPGPLPAESATSDGGSEGCFLETICLPLLSTEKKAPLLKGGRF